MAPFKKMLPSEIARLVYGYLCDCGVDGQLSCKFLLESPYLAECRELHADGDAFHTDFKGLSLKEILQEYSFVHHIVDSKIKALNSSDKCELEASRLSERLCILLNVPERPRSRANSFLTSRLSNLEKPEPVIPAKEPPLQPETEELEVTNELDSSGSYGVPETPGSSLTFHVINGDKAPNVRNPEQERFLNKMELTRDIDKIPPKPQSTITRSLSFNDLTVIHDKRKPKTRPKFFTPNKYRGDDPPKEVILKTLRELYEDKELHEKIAKTINVAREGISQVPPSDLDNAIQTIIEKTTADPSFNEIMEQTLSNFDLLEYLKPVATSVPLQKSPPKSASKNDEKSLSFTPLTVQTSVANTAEFRPYPEIRYDPTDCNIVTGTMDPQGNCVFFTNQLKQTVLTLPPAPKTLTRRPRSILPKIPTISVPDVHPVIVCTPLMPPPVADKPKLSLLRTRPPKKLPIAVKNPEPLIEEILPEPTVEQIIEQTSEETATSLLPNLIATPAQAEAPKKTPSSNTPHKSYIRALEFPTPLKDVAKPSWDTNLRAQLTELEKAEKVSPKKGKRGEKTVKKRPPRKKKLGTVSPRMTRSRKITISPSKNNLTAKRNTYAISHGSSSAFESSSSADEVTTLPNLVEMTPAKEDELNKDPELCKEETPFTKLLRENVSSVDIDLSMIPTPMFPATPCIETATPIHAARNTDYSSGSSYYRPELTSPGSCFNELQEEHVQDVTTPSGTNLVVSPDQLKINDLVNEGKKILGRCSGKNMSFLKLQMIASCELKLGENIPIRESIRDELDRKRKNTLQKIKKGPAKRKKPVKKKETVVADTAEKKTKNKRLSAEMPEIKKEIPPFVDDGEYPTLPLNSRKKLFIAREIIKLPDVHEYLIDYTTEKKINLKPCIEKLFKIIFKWLKHPHQHEMEVARDNISRFLADFRKIHAGITYKKQSSLSNLYEEYKKSGECSSSDGSSIDSTVAKKWTGVKRKTDASLPLKKRRKKNSPAGGEQNVSQAQKILKHIDVDQFLSRVHGQENS